MAFRQLIPAHVVPSAPANAPVRLSSSHSVLTTSHCGFLLATPQK
jgi:hypothetical protein